MLLFVAILIPTLLVAYVPTPELNRQCMVGVWRLTSRKSFLPPITKEVMKETALPNKFPMKEFTVHPKKKSPTSQPLLQEAETLLMLKENGTFFQCGQISGFADDDEDYDDEREKELSESKERSIDGNEVKSDPMPSFMGIGMLKGTWDYLDGKLILAADRPPEADARKIHDTILSGRVVAKSEEGLTDDNPAMMSAKNSSSVSQLSSDDTGTDVSANHNSRANTTTIASVKSNNNTSEHMDVHLSVPKGSVKIGKFMYPKRHPSFFEQPIFQPTKTGSFELRQVLGSLNAQLSSEKQNVEKFEKMDFVNKTFLLTSQPFQQRSKGKLRWSKFEGKYVVDRPLVNPNENVDIRVMKMEFFSNGTFSTIGQTTSQKVLRGNWYITGEDKDQLWIQVCLFGWLGRSTSGSSFSEGRGLTHDDQRIYWGKIYELPSRTSQNGNDTTETPTAKTVEVNGDVLFGCIPQPLSGALHAGISFAGKFTMIETIDDYFDSDIDDDDDDDELFDELGMFE